MVLPHLQSQPDNSYVGTLVGESTSREFRLAVAAEALREQDIIAVDAELHRPEDGTAEPIRVWAKVQRIERINPLFPSEAGHELAATRTNPLDTVLSLSREMVTAVCMVLGAERMGDKSGKLDHLRYPARPASTAYRPDSADVARVVVGALAAQAGRSLDLATLSNRPEVDVYVDGHAIVTRHLAILAMTGAGKSWAARRIIEKLALKNYPIVIFDPHGDYTGLGDRESLKDRVHRYYAHLPLYEEDSETVAGIVDALGYRLSDAMRTRFDDVFRAAHNFLSDNTEEQHERKVWLEKTLNKPDLERFGIRPDMWLVARMAAAAENLLRTKNEEGRKQLQEWAWSGLETYTGNDAKTLEGIKKRTLRAARALQRMEATSQRVAGKADPLPPDRKKLVTYGGITIISLAGYPTDFQAMIYSIIADDMFSARVTGELRLPVLLLLEEAHTFAPASASTEAEKRAITVTKQIAQEGRKFGAGLILISQRPSRLDETTLSQCNSFVIMRMVNPADQNYVRKVVESLGEDDARMLPDLDVGEAILSGQFTNLPILVKIKPPASQGEHEETDAFAELERIHKQMAH